MNKSSKKKKAVKSGVDKLMSQKYRNFYIYYDLLCNNENFSIRLESLKNKWRLPLELKYEASWNFDNIHELWNEFEKSRGQVAEFMKEVNELIKEFDLGVHWAGSLFLHLITGNRIILPDFTFQVSSLESSKKEKVITVELSPYTTLEDIKDSWATFEKVKKLVWPKIRPKKITKKTVDNLIIEQMDYFKTNDRTRKSYDPDADKDIFYQVKDDEIAEEIQDDISISKKGRLNFIKNLRKIRSRRKKKNLNNL